MEEKITMVGLASGLVLGNLGFTHCCIEDVGVLRSIPNLNIISPADSLKLLNLLRHQLKVKNLAILELPVEQIIQSFMIRIINLKLVKLSNLKREMT